MVEDVPQEGYTETYTRTFTPEEVREFADLSEDRGYHHLVAQGEEGLMVHGLLTATLPTKLGGEIDFVARSMTFEFPRPTYTGEEITCELTIDAVEDGDDRVELACSFVCRNEEGEVVLRGESEGVVFD